MGTVPSLVVPSLSDPFTDSRNILKYLDESRGASLTPHEPKLKQAMENIVELVHSSDADANIILLQPRDMEECESKRSGGAGSFVAVRQRVLEYHHSAHPNHSFYGPKAKENGELHRLYTNKLSAEHQAFFEDTRARYVGLAAVLDRLEDLIILPYAAGKQVTHADLHLVPWLAHMMAAVETKEIGDLWMLEAYIRKSVTNFKLGPKLHKWWANYTSRAAFRDVFPVLH